MISALSRFAAFLLVAVLAQPALSSFLFTENFNTNADLAGSGWEFEHNRTAPQNYGWSNTNNTGSTVNPPVSGTATGAGELGGAVSRTGSPPTFYGYNIGSIDLHQDFEARGVIRYSGGSGGFNLGYFRGAESYGSGGNAVNFVGYFFDDSRDAWAVIFRSDGSRDRSDSPYNLVLGTTHAFRMQYKTNGFNPDTLVVTLDGNVHTQAVGFITPSLLPFTHFGILPTSAPGSTGTVWLDDLTFTVNPVIPEPSGLGLLAGLVGLIALRRRSHCSPTWRRS